MSFVQKYGRALVAVATFIVAWATAAWTDGHIGADECQLLVAAGANAVIVYVAPHYPGAHWIKPAASAVLTAGAFLIANLSNGISTYEWAQLAILVLGTLGVVVTPSRSAPELSPVAAVR
jgi:hypothetical protein